MTDSGSASAFAAIDTAFAPITSAGTIPTDLGKQLYQLAKAIADNATVQGNRQIFFAPMGGFDHGARSLPEVQRLACTPV